MPNDSTNVSLNTKAAGIPLLVALVGHDGNDETLREGFLEQGAPMVEKAGCQNISQNDAHQAPGLSIYETGGVRTGPAQNVFVEQVESTAPLQERVCYRWRLHDAHAKPFVTLCGVDGKSGEWRGG